jgi:hypothetical protein
MKQQAAQFAIEGLDNYDGVRPLENFLWVHVRNRLYNFKRNNYSRPTLPCDCCELDAYKDFECTAHENKLDCLAYERWFRRNQIKQNLMSTKPSDDGINDESSVEDQIFSREIYALVERNIPVTMREDWIRFTNKLKLPKNKREALLSFIIQILKEHGINPNE